LGGFMLGCWFGLGGSCFLVITMMFLFRYSIIPRFPVSWFQPTSRGGLRKPVYNLDLESLHGSGLG